MISVVDKITLVTEKQLVHDAHFPAILYLVSSYIPYHRREKERKNCDYDYCLVHFTNKLIQDKCNKIIHSYLHRLKSSQAYSRLPSQSISHICGAWTFIIVLTIAPKPDKFSLQLDNLFLRSILVWCVRSILLFLSFLFIILLYIE
jgi:hypothetical protein